MINTLRTFYDFTFHSLDPLALNSRSLSREDFQTWKAFIAGEDIALRRKIVEFLLSTAPSKEKKAWISSVQQHLTFCSDQLNSFLFRKRCLWQTHTAAAEIKRHYLMSIHNIEESIEFIVRTFPQYYDFNLKFTDFHLKRILPELRVALHGIRHLLAEAGISLKLVEIVSSGLQAVLDQKPSKSDDSYINHLYHTLACQEQLNDQELVHLLLKLDFNQPEFYLYYVGLLDTGLFAVHGLHEQRELLWRESGVCASIKKDSRFRLHPRQSPIVDDLKLYFQEREEAVEALLEIRRAAARDRVSADQAFRILMDMTVPQLALFFRIQMEVGLMLKDQITEVFNFVAQHFYTEKAHFISSTNMLKLSTTIEFNTVLKVHDMLSRMIQWLDDQFGVSNYSR